MKHWLMTERERYLLRQLRVLENESGDSSEIEEIEAELDALALALDPSEAEDR